jgi:hypothetical protein
MAFNRADAGEIADLYADDGVNHQIAREPVLEKICNPRGVCSRFCHGQDDLHFGKHFLKMELGLSLNGVTGLPCADSVC